MSPAFGPISQRDLVSALRSMGFQGPFSGSRHPFMAKGALLVTIPNPHRREIGPALLARLLRQARITRREWERL
jgi:predicted RNA binding protein YcfA (HicA-like mRNA interferase family)